MENAVVGVRVDVVVQKDIWVGQSKLWTVLRKFYVVDSTSVLGLSLR